MNRSIDSIAKFIKSSMDMLHFHPFPGTIVGPPLRGITEIADNYFSGSGARFLKGKAGRIAAGLKEERKDQTFGFLP